MTTNRDVARDCPPACATIHTSPFDPDEHHQRFGAVAARRDPIDGGDPISIGVEALYPVDEPPTVAVAAGGPDEADDTIWHLTPAQARALAGKLRAAADAVDAEASDGAP